MHLHTTPNGLWNFSTCAFTLFFLQLFFTSKADATKKGREFFAFTSKNKCLQNYVVCYRDRECVPVFPWSFLPSTRDFETSMTHPVSKDDPDHCCKEEHTIKFMMLFMPHRKFDNLKLNGSHQKCLQAAIKDNETCSEMIEIANNTQNIHNSLNLMMPQNHLALNTEFIDPENFELDDDETDEEDETANLHLLQLMQDAFGDDGAHADLSEDSKIINPVHEKRAFRTPAE